jgi:prolyl-tRNA synthetase
MADNSQIKINVKKDEDFSEWFTQLMQKAELADVRYNVKGFPVYRPWAVRSIRKITRMWEAELERLNHEPLIMPLLIPESNFLREADHVKGFTPEVFWVTEGGNTKFEERLALRPTSETALYDMYGKWLQSYKDLPMKFYQSVSVFRYETKMTRPFMRTRELHWTEAHNVFATEKDAMNQVKEDMEITHKLLYGKMALPHIFFQRPQWDKFPGAVNTYAADVLLPSGKVLQLPSTHLIGQNFSKAFNVKFIDANEKEDLGWMTCYGPCHSRNYGALITFHGDDKGLIIPWDIAPKHIVIVPIFKKENKDLVLNKCKALAKKLKKYEVMMDEREDMSPGWKFNQWEMKGVPIRIELGERDIQNNQVTIFRRDIELKEAVKESDMLNYIKNIEKTFTKNLIKKADDVMREKLVDATTLDEIKAGIDKGFMVRTCMPSIDMDSEEIATKIEKELGGEVRGTKFGTKEKVFCNCPITGKKAKVVVYIAKSH